MIINLLLSFIFIENISFATNEIKSSVIKSDPTSGKVEIEAIGANKLLKINGIGEGVSSNLKIDGAKLSGEVSFKLESLKTGIDSRDEIMKETYLQVKHYPAAKIIFKEFQMPINWSLQNPKLVSSSFRGKLTLHGIEHEITGLFSIDPVQLKTTANFDIKLSDYNIEIPIYLGVKVADFVKVNITIDKLLIVK